MNGKLEIDSYNRNADVQSQTKSKPFPCRQIYSLQKKLNLNLSWTDAIAPRQSANTTDTVDHHKFRSFTLIAVFLSVKKYSLALDKKDLMDIELVSPAKVYIYTYAADEFKSGCVIVCLLVNLLDSPFAKLCYKTWSIYF